MEEDPRLSDTRPSPDALLETAERELRGKLKIFFGAAPGVGKTYEMLGSGRTQRDEGVDVVIGVVETHGRGETAALVDGFEVIPRVKIGHKGHRLEEMDLDAILLRQPQLVLVDELAHSNAPGARHPKRFQDVEEILARGINVYTTLNVQHVESLNDIVAQITGIRVRETVPDSIIDRADDIEIIDLTPDDLIKRLNEGKVYLPGTAQRAIKHYFRPGNLTALRELALRRTAQRVDDQLVTHMQANAIDGPWAAGDRILVCVDHRAGGGALVRHARRRADRMRAPWEAIYIETPRSVDLSEPEKNALTANLRLAEQLDGTVKTLPGQDIAQEIIRYATASNVTHIIIGKSTRPRWRDYFQRSILHEVIRLSGNISVDVVAGTAPVKDALGGVASARPPRKINLQSYALSTLYVAVAVGFGMFLDQFLDVRNVALVFLMAILTSAVSAGFGPALYASFASAIAFNFFFLPPVHTLTIRDPESVIALVFFLLVGITASNLTARVQRQAVAASKRARVTQELNHFSRKLAGAGTLDDVLWATSYQIASMLNVRVVLLLPEQGTLIVKAGYPPDDTLDDADIAAARWTWEHDRPAGRGADTLPGARRLYLPLRTKRNAVGVIGLDDDREGPLLTPDQRRLLDALADQSAVAIERIQLVHDLDRARLVAESDRLRSALLTSISHDLKTPLAAIMGAAGTLRDYADALPKQDRVDLLGSVIDESERLNRFISNLLDMTRLESGAIQPNWGLHDLSDIVGTALRRAAKILRDHPVSVVLEPDLPMLRIDPVLFEQVMFNLLDNAAKYAPAGSDIAIRAWVDSGSIVVQIMDEGPGIPPEDLESVFNSFYRVRKTDHVTAGTGLGLSICRGFVEALGGKIIVRNRTGHSGAVFTIRLPIPSASIRKDPSP